MGGKTKFKVGGSGNGMTTPWGDLNAANLKVDGWEMKFKVDSDGNVSGGNKNDTVGDGMRKTYSGTFKDGKLNCKVVFENGQTNTYEGSLDGKVLTVKVTLLKSAGASTLEGSSRLARGVLQEI